MVYLYPAIGDANFGKTTVLPEVGASVVTVEPPVEPETVVVVCVVATAMVDPPLAAICLFRSTISLTAALYFSVAAALRLVCFVTASAAVDLAASFFVESLFISPLEQGVFRGNLISNKAVIRVITSAGLFVKVSVILSINLSTEVHVIGTGWVVIGEAVVAVGAVEAVEAVVINSHKTPPLFLKVFHKFSLFVKDCFP